MGSSRSLTVRPSHRLLGHHVYDCEAWALHSLGLSFQAPIAILSVPPICRSKLIVRAVISNIIFMYLLSLSVLWKRRDDQLVNFALGLSKSLSWPCQHCGAGWGFYGLSYVVLAAQYRSGSNILDELICSSLPGGVSIPGENTIKIIMVACWYIW